ncbi:MAG: YIP1 family protein [Elusimicrobia bacterium]|nr:YIP1 family protein [Elusimicrobiota bacterium]
MAKAPDAPFEAPSLDAPVKATLPAVKSMSMPSTTAAFQAPAEGPAAGTFQFGGPPAPAPFTPKIEDKLPLTSPPPPVPAAPPKPVDRNAALRQPHTAPPIRLPGNAAPKATPIPGLPAAAPVAAPVVPPKAAAAAVPVEPFGSLGFVQLAEQAGLFVLSTKTVLERFKSSPQPPVWLLLAHGLAWAAASMVIRAGLGYGKASALLGTIVAPKLGTAFAIGLVVASIGLMIGAAIVHGLGKLSGGAAPFGRALLTISLLAPLSALSAALSPIEALWWAPFVLSMWLIGRAIVSFYAAPVWQAGIVVGGAALFGGVLQYAGHRAAMNIRQAAEAVAPLSAAAAAASGTTPGLAASGPGGALTAEQAAVLEQLKSAGAIPPPGGTQPSGLEMLNGAASAGEGTPPGEERAVLPPFLMPMTPALGRQPTPEEIQQLKGAGAQAIQRATAVLDDPKMTDGMSEQQKEQFRQARGSLDAMMKAAQTGQKPSAAQTQQLMQSLQQMMQSATVAPQQQASPRKRRRRRVPTSDEQ